MNCKNKLIDLKIDVETHLKERIEKSNKYCKKGAGKLYTISDIDFGITLDGKVVIIKNGYHYGLFETMSFLEFEQIINNIKNGKRY